MLEAVSKAAMCRLSRKRPEHEHKPTGELGCSLEVMWALSKHWGCRGNKRIDDL